MRGATDRARPRTARIRLLRVKLHQARRELMETLEIAQDRGSAAGLRRRVKAYTRALAEYRAALVQSATAPPAGGAKQCTRRSG